MILIACPGSGKTTTLLRRIHHMVADCGIPADQILMITFTRAAAAHMREQYLREYGASGGVTFSTIHALCNATLRKFRGVTPDQILSEGEIREFLRDRVRRSSSINDKDEFISDFLTDLTVMRNNRISASDFVPACTKDVKMFRNLSAAYDRFRQDNHRIDYDDMLLMTADALENDRQVLSFLRNRYRYIQVDEYQDVNGVQRDIIYAIAGKEGNLAVVGDDDQSIYGFRGARPEIMLEFRKDYPGAAVIPMSVNYRSGSEIIRQAGALISNNRERFEKDFTGSRNTSGRVTVIPAGERREEIGLLVQRIRGEIAAGRKPEEIAVLYRNNSQAEAVADACMDQNVDFSCSDTIRGRYEHWIYRDILAYHRLAAGEGTRKDLLQVLNHPNRYFSRDLADCGLDQEAMDRAVWSDDKPYWQVANARKAIAAFFDLLRVLRLANPAKTMDALEYAGDYLTYLSQYAEYRHEDEEELKAIWNQLKEDAAGKKDFDEWSAFGSEYMEKLRESMKERTGVALSTMHRAKGLEWESVYIIDADEGIHPYKEAQDAGALEEERRLFYVAMTRAKDNLTIFYYKTAGGKVVDPSPYLGEIRKALEETRQNQSEGVVRGLIRKIQDESLRAMREMSAREEKTDTRKTVSDGTDAENGRTAMTGQADCFLPGSQSLDTDLTINLTADEIGILNAALNNFLRMQKPGWKESELLEVAPRTVADRPKAYVRRTAEPSERRNSCREYSDRQHADVKLPEKRYFPGKIPSGRRRR